MVTLELKQKIILKYLEGKSQRKISKELRTARQTVNKYIEEYNSKKIELLQKDILKNSNEIIEDIVALPKYDSSNRKKIVVTDEVIEIIKNCLSENKQKRANGQAKQTMKATDIHELLSSKGFNISYPSVAQTVNKLLNKTQEAFIRQEYKLGDVCEFDWGETKLNIDSKGYRKYQMAAFTSACGNYRYSVLFETQDTVAFQQSHSLFFEHIGGVYNTLVYDNMKVAVARFVGRNEKEPTEGLLKLSIYYGFEFRFCNVRAGNEKGHVERSIEYIRRKAFAFKDTFNSLKEANEYLLSVCAKLNNKPLSTDNITIPAEILKQEIPYMLPKMPMFDPADAKDFVPDKYSTIIYKHNRYSVPDKYTGKIVFVKAYADKIKIYYENDLVAEHVRTFGLNEWNIKLEHYLDTLHKKNGALANSTAMLKLDTKIKNIYDKYYTDNPKEFLDLYEIILEKGIHIVEEAIEKLLLITPTDITTDKIKLICNRQEVSVIASNEKDEITKASEVSLMQYTLLIPNASIEFQKEEVLV